MPTSTARKKIWRLSWVLVTSVMLSERRQQMLSINRIVSVRCGGDYSSVLLGTAKASAGVLSLVSGITFQEKCESVGDGWKAAKNS